MEEKIRLNPFIRPDIVAGYETWYQTVGLHADQQEKSLMKWLLAHFQHAKTILEVGCGTGHFTRWLGVLGMQAAGLDLSHPMLEEAKGLGSAAYLQGDALMLPFLSKSIDLVAMITTLEFLSEPGQGLAEARRVAREGLILGVLNAKSHLGQRYKREGGPIWKNARFFTPDELLQMIQETIGDEAGVSWRTTLWPLWPGALPLPWGGFIGMAVKFFDAHMEDK